MTTKHYALSGTNEFIELGKDGHVIDGRNAGYIEVKGTDGGYIRVKGSAATASNEFVIKSQLDAVNALAGGYSSYYYDPAQPLSQLAGQGSGEGGAILYSDTFKVGGTNASFTLFGIQVETGDLISALVAGADTTDETGANVDWIVIETRTASDLADGISTDHAAGKIIVKDGGVSTDKLAANAVTEVKMADDSVSTRTVQARAVTGAKVALATLGDEHVALNQITKAKMSSAVQTTLTRADTVYNTRVPNIASAIGGGFNVDNDSTIAGQQNYATGNTIVAQLGQLDSRIKLDNDDDYLRRATVTFDGGAQNIGSPIKSGRAILRVAVTPITVANGSNCTMSIGVAGDAAKYMAVADIDLYEGSPNYQIINLPVASNEQIIATVTQGSATQGSFFVTVEHG